MTYDFAVFDHEFRFAGIFACSSSADAIKAAKARGVIAPMVERAKKQHYSMPVSNLSFGY